MDLKWTQERFWWLYKLLLLKQLHGGQTSRMRDRNRRTDKQTNIYRKTDRGQCLVADWSQHNSVYFGLEAQLIVGLTLTLPFFSIFSA